MRFNRLYVRYCCEELKWFLDKVETTKLQWKPREGGIECPVRIGFHTSTGPYGTGLYYCPFCGIKIEWDESIGCEEREDI